MLSTNLYLIYILIFVFAYCTKCTSGKDNIKISIVNEEDNINKSSVSDENNKGKELKKEEEDGNLNKAKIIEEKENNNNNNNKSKISISVSEENTKIKSEDRKEVEDSKKSSVGVENNKGKELKEEDGDKNKSKVIEEKENNKVDQIKKEEENLDKSKVINEEKSESKSENGDIIKISKISKINNSPKEPKERTTFIKNANYLSETENDSESDRVNENIPTKKGGLFSISSKTYQMKINLSKLDKDEIDLLKK